jgi:hypothetical protein
MKKAESGGIGIQGIRDTGFCYAIWSINLDILVCIINNLIRFMYNLIKAKLVQNRFGFYFSVLGVDKNVFKRRIA